MTPIMSSTRQPQWEVTTGKRRILGHCAGPEKTDQCWTRDRMQYSAVIDYSNHIPSLRYFRKLGAILLLPVWTSLGRLLYDFRCDAISIEVSHMVFCFWHTPLFRPNLDSLRYST